MFVDEKAEGEPHLPEMPYRLPMRLFVAILAPLPVAIFSYSMSLGFSFSGATELSVTWANVGCICLAFSLAATIVSFVLVRAAWYEFRVPPT